MRPTLSIQLILISVMENILHSPKSSNDWTQNELRAYNIQVVEQSLVEFFQLPPLPLQATPTIHHFCETTHKGLALDGDTYRLLYFLNCTHNGNYGQKAALTHLMAILLEKMGYVSDCRIDFLHQLLPLIICGKQCSAQMDVCICDENSYHVLLVQENEIEGDDDSDICGDPEPQVIVEAITAYQRNNFI